MEVEYHFKLSVTCLQLHDSKCPILMQDYQIKLCAEMSCVQYHLPCFIMPHLEVSEIIAANWRRGCFFFFFY